MSKKFATDDYEIARIVYGNGVTWKFDNRRVSVIQEENGFAFQFKTLDRDSAPHVNCRFDRGVLHTTTMRLSREAGELLMFSLAEMIGLMPVYDNNLIKEE